MTKRAMAGFLFLFAFVLGELFDIRMIGLNLKEEISTALFFYKLFYMSLGVLVAACLLPRSAPLITIGVWRWGEKDE